MSGAIAVGGACAHVAVTTRERHLAETVESFLCFGERQLAETVESVFCVVADAVVPYPGLKFHTASVAKVVIIAPSIAIPTATTLSHSNNS